MSESKVILVTGASSGFGALTVRTLADAKHVVYAGMRGLTGRNEQSAAAARAYADEHGVTLRPVEMDVSDQDSVDQAVASVLAEAGRRQLCGRAHQVRDRDRPPAPRLRSWHKTASRNTLHHNMLTNAAYSFTH